MISEANPNWNGRVLRCSIAFSSGIVIKIDRKILKKDVEHDHIFIVVCPYVPYRGGLPDTLVLWVCCYDCSEISANNTCQETVILDKIFCWKQSLTKGPLLSQSFIVKIIIYF